MQTVFSGIQPTGNLHLGNYLGAIKNWKNIISSSPNSQFFFSIVDLHAITVYQNSQELRRAILQTFATYLACGIDGKNITVFQQSMVSQHAELAWVLSCHIQMGFLERMTQYKEKIHSHKEKECLGLCSYPVLMAADILLYRANIVPVGEDQVQHVELTRDIAKKFNAKYGKEILTLPQAKLSPSKRVMSLKDGMKKMSKSDESGLSRINLLDDADVVQKKIKKAKTGNINSPEIKNLLEIYNAVGGNVEFNPENMEQFKINLTDAIIAEIQPIQKRYTELMQSDGDLSKTLASNAENAHTVAQKNLTEIYKEIGIR